MITVEDINLSGFTEGIEGLILELGIKAERVVSHETGELIKTLVKVTPPNDLQKSRKAIDAKVDSQFKYAAIVGSFAGEDYSAKHQMKPLAGLNAPSGVIWYGASRKFLYGFKPENDMRSASTETLQKLFYTMTKHGRQSLPFKSARKNQRALISENIAIKPAQKTALKARLKRSVGRLKAGWCVAFFAGVIKISGSIPQYVTRHAQGAKGRFTDGLRNKDAPYFEIANSALGVDKAAYLAQKALDIRAKAMVANTELFWAGKKHLSDYAKGEHAFEPAN